MSEKPIPLGAWPLGAWPLGVNNGDALQAPEFQPTEQGAELRDAENVGLDRHGRVRQLLTIAQNIVKLQQRIELLDNDQDYLK